MPIESNDIETLSVVDRKKHQHLKTILTRAYFSSSFTISTIAKAINISIPSATAYINELMVRRWLFEADSVATASGRRPSIFKLNPEKKHFLIVDINTRTTTLYLVDLSHVIKEKKEIALLISDIDFPITLLNELKTLIEHHGKPWAIGVSSPGLIDKKREANLTYINHNVGELSIIQWLKKELQADAFLINDTRASLLGEYYFGYVKKKKNVILLNLDWGIGLGILANGAIVEGSDGFSGELGHIRVKPEGKRCHCGKTGCLDTVASASAILSTATEGLEKGVASLLQERKSKVTIEDIIWAVNQGDAFAISVVNAAAHELGKGLAVVIHLLNPHTIIIDGVLSRVGDLIKSGIRTAINDYCIDDFKNGLDIVVSPLGDLSKVYGTSAYVFNKMIAN